MFVETVVPWNELLSSVTGASVRSGGIEVTFAA